MEKGRGLLCFTAVSTVLKTPKKKADECFLFQPHNRLPADVTNTNSVVTFNHELKTPSF